MESALPEVRIDRMRAHDDIGQRVPVMRKQVCGPRLAGGDCGPDEVRPGTAERLASSSASCKPDLGRQQLF